MLEPVSQFVIDWMPIALSVVSVTLIKLEISFSEESEDESDTEDESRYWADSQGVWGYEEYRDEDGSLIITGHYSQ